VSITDDWHLAHPADEKYALVEQHTIKYEPCAACGELMRPLPPALTKRFYASNKEIDPEKIRRLCPKCRQIEDANNKLQKAQEASPKADEATPGTVKG
jgi:cytidine deaminase